MSGLLQKAGASDIERVANSDDFGTRDCLREPIPEIFEAARLLDAAVSAHHLGRKALADELIRLADLSAIMDLTHSL